MKNNKIWIQITSFVLISFFNASLQGTVKKLDLDKGSICQKGKGPESNYVCSYAEDCNVIEEKFQNNNYYTICSFNKSIPIICCPPKAGTEPVTNVATNNIRTRIVDEKCLEYSKLADSKNFQRSTINSTERGIRFKLNNKNAILVGNCESELQAAFDEIERKRNQILVVGYGYNGKQAAPKEFPHMAILGYGESVDDNMWGCGGSLISERWILTAAHCQQMGSPDYLARWARLGDLNLARTNDDARPKDYQIVQRVIHPCYTPSSRYNDIALFRLETDVEFSAYVRPICLNSENKMDPTYLVAPGWGKTAMGEPMSDALLSVNLITIWPDSCNASYATSIDKKTLKFGIMKDRMICAGSEVGKQIQDTCQGDSGGPLQTLFDNQPKVYMQYGITSFGRHCGDRDSPGVYTRVSKYITWIESIVWPYY